MNEAVATTKKTKLVTKMMVAEPYPRINGDPNTKFDSDGVWELKATFKDSEDVDDMVMLIEERLEEFVNQWKKENKNKKPRFAPKPYNELDNGTTVFKFKNKALFKKTGTKFIPPCFDSKGNRINKNIKVYGGTELRVRYTPYCWYVPSMGIGISLRLLATSIWNLVEAPPEEEFDNSEYGDDGFVADGNGNGNHNSNSEEIIEESSEEEDF